MIIFLKILFLFLAYMVGSIPFGLIIGKIKKIDVRDIGSHNIGAANTGRALGKKYAVLTFILDMIKGALFVVLFRYEIIPNEYLVLSPALYGLLSVTGHLFPVYLKFKGGKGVATGAGFIFAYTPLLIPIGLLAFIITVKITKIASISSLASTTIVTLAAIVYSIIGVDSLTNVDVDIFFGIFSVIIAALIFFKHIPNIIRLLNKNENKV